MNQFARAHNLAMGAVPNALVCNGNEFDVERYMGTWYELARYPTAYQNDWETLRSEWKLKRDGTISVKDTVISNKDDDPSGSSTGEEQQNDTITRCLDHGDGGRDATFNRVIHDTDYDSYAIVGNEARTTLWIMSRAPYVSHYKYKQLVHIASRIGYDANQIV